jgi:hypothetical protein
MPTVFCPLCRHTVEDMAAHLKTEEHKRNLRGKARAARRVYLEIPAGDPIHCPHCGGRAFCRDLEDPADEWHCLNCARVVIFSEK